MIQLSTIALKSIYIRVRVKCITLVIVAHERKEEVRDPTKFLQKKEKSEALLLLNL